MKNDLNSNRGYSSRPESLKGECIVGNIGMLPPWESADMYYPGGFEQYIRDMLYMAEGHIVKNN